MVAMLLSAIAGIAAWVLAERALTSAGAPMEIEIPFGLAAMAAGYFAVHAATLRLKPREEEPTLKL